MKKLKRLLFASICAVTIVALIFVLDESSNQSKKYLGTMQSAIGSAQTAFDFNNVMQKVTGSENATGSANTNGNLKSDLKISDGTGTLVTDANTKETAAASAKSKASSVGSPNFPAEMYPYRELLTPSQQTVYDLAYENAIQRNASFKVNVTLDKAGLTSIMTALYNDHPELFWMDTSYSYGYTTSGTVVSITLEFNDTVNNYSSCKNKFDSIANTIIAGTSGLSSDLEKEKYVYKYLMNIDTYDENSLLNQSSYSAIVNGKSVCAGYSRAFQYIMQQIGIPCYFCSGYANNNYHAWNIVKIGGTYYNADLSWDDSLGEATNTYSFEYFNISDSVMSKDHTRRDLSVKLPGCN